MLGVARPAEQPAEAVPKATPKKTKVSYYAAAEDTNRARAAYAHTHIYEGVISFSDFVAAAVLEKTQRLEESYNAGEPWAPLEPGKLPTGRPIL
ncbi:ParB family protein [Agromyces bauzanensis]